MTLPGRMPLPVRRCEPAGDAAHHCVTCGDDGDPMRVIAADEVRGIALCEDGDGGRHSVEIALVPPVAPGAVLLVHAGTALLVVEEAIA